MRLARAKKKDERGAILIFAGLGIVLAMIASALAVDIGFLAHEARANQKVADLAALDAARVLPADPTTAAGQSAARNGYTVTADNFKVECATVPTGPYTAAVCTSGGSNAVKVTVTTIHSNKFPLVPGGQRVARDAASAIQKRAGFSLGSALARVDVNTAQAPVFDRILERLLGSSSGSISLTAVGYDGLAESYVTLGELQSALGFATVNEMLDADLTAAEILQATSTVMQGDTSQAYVDTILGSIGPSSVANTADVKLGDMITVAAGAEDAAASTGINVLQLITGSAQLANGQSFVAVPNAIANIPVPGVGSVGSNIELSVIEPAKTYIGTVGGTVSTSQVKLKFTPTINVGVSLPLPIGNLLRAVGSLEVIVGGAGATGTLTDVRCTAPQGITVSVLTAGSTTQVMPSSIGLRTLGNLLAATVNVTGLANGIAHTTSPPFDFDYPAEFSPTAPSQQTPSSSLNTALTATSTGSVTISIAAIFPLPPINVTLPANVVGGAVLTAVRPVLDAIATLVQSQEFAAIGASIGLADVAALRDAFVPTGCGQPALID